MKHFNPPSQSGPLCSPEDRQEYWLSAREEAAKAVVGLALGRLLDEIASGVDGGHTRFVDPDPSPGSADAAGLFVLERAVTAQAAWHVVESLDDVWEETGALPPVGADPGGLSDSFGYGHEHLDDDDRLAIAQAAAVCMLLDGTPAPSAEAIRRELVRADIRADGLLRRFWPQVQRLAEAICHTGRTGPEVLALIGDLRAPDGAH